MYRVWEFAKHHAMPVVAVIAALVTCCFVPPDAEYAGYVDVSTLVKLACMLLAVGGLGASGFFQWVARAIVSRCSGARVLVFALVGVTAVASMFVTNDMALLALLPLAAACLIAAGRRDLIALVFVLQGLAANLCGMLLPFGNPQNIYLAGAYDVSFADFVAVMLPPFAVSCVLVALGCALVGGRGKKAAFDEQAGRDAASLRAGSRAGAFGEPCELDGCTHPAGGGSLEVPVQPVERRLAVASLVALAACVTTVVHALPVWACALVVVVCVFAGDVSLFAKTDWSLVVTFAAFFVFSGNLARIPAVQEGFAAWIAAMGGAFVPAALLSQVVSNVPAAIVLSRFAGDWAGLLAGVNVGGAGTPIASLATLIVIAQYGAVARGLGSARGEACGLAGNRGFLLQLILANLVALAVLLLAGCLLGW